MSLPDPTYSAALDATVINPVFFACLDILGDPVRANTSGRNITPTATGDADLDGFEFIGISGDLVQVSSVKFKTGGSESVTATLSGIAGLDDATIALLENPANWRGREARLWNIVRNASYVQQGAFHPYYTGRMTALKHSGSATDQTITVTIESYLAALSKASGRTYMVQEKYDAGDLSARAAIAIANGNFTNAGAA